VEGYRLNHFTKEDCFRSLWSWHNETLNIWTHLLGSIMFIGMGIWFFAYYDSCRDVYVRMIQDIKAANFSWDWDSMARNMEVFKNQLTGSAPAQEVGIGQVMQSLTVDIDRALAKKMDLLSFIAIFTGGNTLAQYTATHEDWMPTFSQYHRFVLGLNKKMDILDTQQISPKLDFAKMEIFSKIGATLPRREVHTNLSIWPIIVYFLCALLCLGCSTVFHWFHPMSRRVFNILHRADLSGITILIFGSVSACIYYAFYCNPIERDVWICLQFISCFGTFCLAMTDWFNDECNIRLKGGTFGACGLFAGVTCFNLGYNAMSQGPDSDALPFWSSFFYCGLMGCLYLVGLGFYTFRFPESLCPGKCMGFNSHVIWH
jgi:adiponectin receptor